MPKKKSKEHINGEWLKDVINRRGFSVRALTNPERVGSIPYNIRTVQRAIADNEITHQLLDSIAKAIDVHPDFLRGKYLWTLQMDIMKYQEVRGYWLEHYLNPNYFPYRMYKQEKLGSYRHFKNTLLMHGVSEGEYRGLPRKERESLMQCLNTHTTKILKHWFPNSAQDDYADYSDVYEWQNENDVYEAMLDWLIDKGYVKAYFPGEDCEGDLFSEDA
jgi:hypothetical protein